MHKQSEPARGSEWLAEKLRTPVATVIAGEMIRIAPGCVMGAEMIDLLGSATVIEKSRGENTAP